MNNNFEAFQKQGQENLQNAVKSMNAVVKSFQDTSNELTNLWRKYFETSSEAAEKILAAKTLEKAVEVQAEYARNSYQNFVAQANRFGEFYVDLAREAYKPFEAAATKAGK